MLGMRFEQRKQQRGLSGAFASAVRAARSLSYPHPSSQQNAPEQHAAANQHKLKLLPGRL
jgi:hypothetical protein